MTLRLLASTALLSCSLLAGAAHAACGVDKGSVRILSNDFEALRIIADAAAECAAPGVTVTRNQTTEHKTLQVAALTVNPAQYTVAMIANNSIVPLMNDNLIRPLDDLVSRYGQQLVPNQLIKVGGKVMAIAFMGNAQTLAYRKDILDKAGVQPPTSYEEVLAAAKVIKDKGLMAYPVAMSDKAGWDLAAEFVNMYLGEGGTLFKADSAAPAINNDKGAAALKMMKDLAGYSSPDYLSVGADELNKIYQGGNAAMMNQWGSLVGADLDPKGASPAVAAGTALAATPTVGGGTIPAAALWWDGFSLAKNISDEDADASFQAMMHGIRPEVAAAHPNVAVWLVKGYVPGPSAVGVLATAKGGAKLYPMLPYMGLLHTALGTELVKFMQGQESADAALASVEASYTAAAKQSGFLN